jgi:myo-inositol-1(or 4)-monophosphatase
MSDDLALIIEAAREAGALAQTLRRQGLTTEYKSGDNSPVTNADLAADRLLTERLRAARPDYGWLSEETVDDADRLTRRRVFVVDPIDGTRSYLKDRPFWSVSIAVVEGDLSVAGAVFAPDLDQMSPLWRAMARR